MAEITYEKLFRGGYRAKLGAFEECAKTKKEAREALFNHISAQPSDLTPEVELDEQGKPWIFWWEGRNWCYSTPARPPLFCILQGSKDDAVAAMRRHMAQYYT